jgi:pyruvate dehydrogenase E2 component (dihydrolipoamide acetyltransferase)
MDTEIRLEKMSDTMEAATVVRWFKKAGEQVSAGEIIGELETDKAGVELESPVSGVVARILVAEGTENVPVGELLMVIDSSAKAAAPSKPDEPAERNQTPSKDAEQDQPAALAPDGNHDRADAKHDRDYAGDASPLARAMAEITGIELSSIEVAGGGRITRTNVEEKLGLNADRRTSRVPQRLETAAGASRPSSSALPRDVAVATRAPVTNVAHTSLRRTIAARMTESKQSIPHFYLSVECDVGGASNLLDRWRAEKLEARITLTCLAIKATAAAIRLVPAVNSHWTPEHLVLEDEINIAVGVATDGGLLAPVIRNADRKALREIASELHELVERGRNGRLRPQDTGGGTFTISNLGMFGVESLFPIITPGQSCVLGLGALRESPVVRGGTVAIGRVMTATLSGDHRALDGAQGARFLSSFKMLVEEPARILL